MILYAYQAYSWHAINKFEHIAPNEKFSASSGQI